MNRKTKYRIYSSISREIFDKIWQIFPQFNLYEGKKFGSGKHDFMPYLCVLRPSKPLKRKIKKMKFWSFFNLFFQLDLRGSTYSTPVYTVVFFTSWYTAWHFYSGSCTRNRFYTHAPSFDIFWQIIFENFAFI